MEAKFANCNRGNITVKQLRDYAKAPIILPFRKEGPKLQGRNLQQHKSHIVQVKEQTAGWAISDLARMVFLAVAELLHPVVPEPSSCGHGQR